MLGYQIKRKKLSKFAYDYSSDVPVPATFCEYPDPAGS